MKNIRYLDGWRGLAILGVLFGHFVTSSELNAARLGVELFFVLSGRLMAEILFVRNKPLPQFYPRRVTRILPALLVYVGFAFIIGLARNAEPTWQQSAAAVTFTINYLNPYVGHAGALDHIWSLCIEEHMYVVLGLIAYLHRKRPLPLVPIFAALALFGIIRGAALTAAGWDYYDVYWRTDVRGASLLLGVVAFLWTPKGFGEDKPWLAPILLIGGIALNMNAVPDPIKYSLGTALLAQSLVLFIDAPAKARAIFEHPLMVRVGIWSYSLYLWQQPFSKLPVGPITKIALLPVVFLVALGSFYFIERPVRERLNDWLARDRTRLPRGIETGSKA